MLHPSSSEDEDDCGGPPLDMRYAQTYHSTPSHDHHGGGPPSTRTSLSHPGSSQYGTPQFRNQQSAPAEDGYNYGPIRSNSSRSYTSQSDYDQQLDVSSGSRQYNQSQSINSSNSLHRDDSRNSRQGPAVDQRSLSAASQDNISLSAASSSGFHSRTASAHSTHGGRPSVAGHGAPGGDHQGGARGISPSPSVMSARTTSKETVFSEKDKAEKEEDERRRKLQLYVFTMRAVAYPFCAKHPTELPRRYLKVTKQQHQSLKERFHSFLNGETNIVADEAFTNAVRSYHEVFLRSDRVASMVRSGGCSMFDFREVFRINIEKRIRCLPEMEELRKETVLSKWIAMFDQISRGDEERARGPSQRLHVPQSEAVLSKEQLYDLFQNIIGVKKYEHQILYNACQLDNTDEQAAQVRRELDAQLQKVEEMSKTRKMPVKFVVKEMDALYVEEMNSMISELMSKLECVPVTKGPSSFQKFKKHNRSNTNSTDDDAININKIDIQLSFSLEVVVIQVKNLKSLPPNKIVFCIMEVNGGEKLQTDQAEASKPYWHTQGDFTTFNPLSTVKVKLCTESGSILQDHKELGRIVLKVTCNTTRQPEWYKMKTPKSCPDPLALQLCIRMDKPNNLKYCGNCYVQSKVAFKKWKLRYLCLIQVSQYTFVMASYRENQSEPMEIMQLDGFTVDYCDAQPDLSTEGGKFFFNLVREGDSAMLATDDENERQMWVQAVYRATGQSHKPTPPTQSTLAKAPNTKAQGDADKARKHGLDEYVSTMPCNVSHNELFRILQRLTLEFRLADPYASQGWFSPGQMLVLDEYCARYGVRGCHRHLCYMSDLVDKAEAGIHIDPDIIHFSYDYCATHVYGTKQDAAIRTVTTEERDLFFRVKERLIALLEKQVTEFRYCFPFGRPERALKKTLGLLERVLMKETGDPASTEDVRAFIKKALEQAALVNYTRISEYASIEGNLAGNPVHRDEDIPPAKKLDDIIHLGELCIEVLQQNEEHHAEDFKEAFAWFSDLLVDHAETFWSLFAVDMMAVLEQQPPETWDSFPLFQLLNDYLIMDDNLRNGKFHKQLQEVFAPQVVRYVDLMESSITQSILKGLEKERWTPATSGAQSESGIPSGCTTGTELVWKISALQNFIKELHWPEDTLAEHLDNRLKSMAAEMIVQATEKTVMSFDNVMKRAGKGTDFIIPVECCIMMNTLIDLKVEIFKLCAMEHGTNLMQYHEKAEGCLEKNQRKLAVMLNERLMSALEGVLVKLARYDENSLLSSFLSLAKPTDEIGKEYIDFMRGNLEQLRQSVGDELLVVGIYESWYTNQMRMIKEWLVERADFGLHPYQLTCLSAIVKKMYSDFELQETSVDVLNNSNYTAVNARLTAEEATSSLKQDSTIKAPKALGIPGRGFLGSIGGSISGSISSLSNGLPTPSFFGKG